jgi:methylmalonyl-CoA mutase N-terminal domain/subunit
VNKYEEQAKGESDRGMKGDLLKVDPELGKRRAAEIATFKKSRDHTLLARELEAVGVAAKGKTNLMSAIVGAVRAQATVGEVSDALRHVFGEYDRLR